MEHLQAMAASLPHGRGEPILSMFHSGEEVLALEVLLSNIYEYEISVTEVQASWLRSAALQYPISSAALDDLNESLPEPAVDPLDQRLTAALCAAHVEDHWDTSPSRLAAMVAALAVQDDTDRGALVERLVYVGGGPNHPVSAAVRQVTGAALRLGEDWEDFQRLTGTLTEALLMPSPPPVDLLGLAADFSGVDRDVLAGVLEGAGETFQGTLSDIEDLHSEVPEDKARAQQSLQKLLAMLRGHGLEVSDEVLSAPASPPLPDAEAGKALLSEGLGLLKSLLDDPESAAAGAKDYVKKMEERFSHLVPESPETSEAELKAEVRASIAEALKDLKH